MAKTPTAAAPKKSPAVNRRLVAELQKYLADAPAEVLGHIEAPAFCCGNGTVALVKIDKGDPEPRG
jgi:hypothetical protein